MPDEWFPTATRWPGAAAGWARGRNSVEFVVAHYTVGTDSAALIANQGLATFLVRRDGEVVQFAEVSALVWSAGWANGQAPGIEVEYLPGQDDETFTDASRAATGALVRWLHTEWGVPLEFYDGDRTCTPPAGFVAHRSLGVCHGDVQNHTDTWPRADWDAMVGLSPQPAEEATRMKPTFFVDSSGRVYVYDANNHTKTWVRSPEALNEIAALWALNGVDTTIHSNLGHMVADAVELKPGITTGTGTGLSDADIDRMAAKVAGTLSSRLAS